MCPNLKNNNKIMAFEPVIPFKSSFEFIENFELPKVGMIRSDKFGIQETETEIFTSKNRFDFNFRIKSKSFQENIDKNIAIKNIDLVYNDTSLVLDELFISKEDFSFDGNHSYAGHISRFWPKDFKKSSSYYFKIIIPLQKKIDYHNKLDYRIKYGIIVDIGKRLFRVKLSSFKQPDGNEKYFFTLESNEKGTLDFVAKHTFSILIAIGYITGEFIGGKCYYFVYKSKTNTTHNFFCFSELRASMTSSYVPVFSNPYAYEYYRLPKNRALADKVAKTLRPLSSNEFSKLCEEINSSTDFASILMAVIESSTASLLPMAGGYAIALEALSDLILKEVLQENLAPIKDKKLASLLLLELKATLSRVCPDLDSDSRTPIIKKIDNINQKTNMDNLKAPFELLGIALSKSDLHIIKTRNDLLHGRIPVIDKISAKNIQEENKILFYTSVSLYVLINCLVLKRIGYNNKIVNYPKIYQNYTKIKLKGKHFRQI
ncbi:hypothetical protein [Spirosoma spitsbergense]|uniref:hypothetical protein n=1 Tax=Spirosoma spitsbergense TaxID=431554 RepID=UPI000382A104|nr:hypothetical protein [Spirosoma spitsbergense]